MTNEHLSNVTERVLGGRVDAAMTEHLAACSACRDPYDRAVLVDRMFAGGLGALAVPTQASIDRIGATVLASVAPPPWWVRARSWLRIGGLGLALATAAILLLVVRPSGRDASEDTMQARGATAHADAGIGVRAFCLAADTTRAIGAGEGCGVGDRLRLAVFNRVGHEHMFVLGVDRDLAIKWYEPRPPALHSTNAPRPEAGETPIGRAIRIGVNHVPGPLRIIVVVSRHPVTAAEIEVAVATLQAMHTAVSEITRLPLGGDDLRQATMLVEITR